MKGKRILFLAPTFFGYYKLIESCLINRGCKVDTVFENFSDYSYLYRFFYSKNNKAKIRYTQKYYDTALSRLPDGYDYVLVIRGEALTIDLLKKIRVKNPHAEIIMYQWDSVKNNPNAYLIKDLFDKVFTFDMEDAKKYNWIYRPLFYVEDNNVLLEKTIDFSFIGTLYYKRALLLQKIRKYCVSHDKKLFDYLYSPKIVYYLHKYILRDPRYRFLKKNEVKFVPLSSDAVIDQYRKSKVLVDYTADDQTGLTMRTIESIGYSCKVITNNKRIVDTDIYKYGNIYIYDLDNFTIPDSFVNKGYKDLPNDVLYYYSLNGWVDTIFANTKRWENK